MKPVYFSTDFDGFFFQINATKVYYSYNYDFVAGILEDIKKTLGTIHEEINSDVIKDIYDGELYKEQNIDTAEANSAQEIIKLTAILNTDGVNL